jgi:hypothetical protein
MNPSKDYRDFLRVMASGLRPDERLVVDIVDGDPGEHENMRASRRKYLSPGRDFSTVELPREKNLYVCVMAVPEGVRNRRSENFSGGIALMIDDVGTVTDHGRGIKVPKELIAALKPTALVETSDGNYQAWFRLTEPIRDPDLFDRIIQAFIREKLMGKDPGMASIARIARIPYGTNCKPSRNGWQVRLIELNEDVSYTPSEIVKALKLTLRPAKQKVDAPKVVSAKKEEEDFKYSFFKEYLEPADRRNHDLEDRRHEWKVICPGAWDHSNGVTSGTTVFSPLNRRNGEYETQYYCAHSNCGIKTTSQAIKAILSDNPEAKAAWLKFWNDRETAIADYLEEVNANPEVSFEDIAESARKEKERAESFFSSLRRVAA